MSDLLPSLFIGSTPAPKWRLAKVVDKRAGKTYPVVVAAMTSLLAAGYTPSVREAAWILHTVASDGNRSFDVALFDGIWSCLAVGVNVRDTFGRTPLHHAVLRKDVFTMRKLVNLGADPSLADREDTDAFTLLLDMRHQNQSMYFFAKLCAGGDWSPVLRQTARDWRFGRHGTPLLSHVCHLAERDALDGTLSTRVLTDTVSFLVRHGCDPSMDYEGEGRSVRAHLFWVVRHALPAYVNDDFAQALLAADAMRQAGCLSTGSAKSRPSKARGAI